MNESQNKPNWVEIVTLFVVIIGGGIFTFLFVQLPQTKLAEVETHLARLEINVKGIKDALEIKVKQIENVVAISDLLTDLVPNVQITHTNNKVDLNEKSCRIFFNIKNTGKYRCYVTKPEIIVTTEKITNQKEIKGELIHGKDYDLVNDLPIGTMGDNEDINYDQTIVFKQKELPNKVFVMTTFKSQVDQDIINIALNLLRDSYTKELFKTKSLKFNIYSIDIEIVR